MSDRLRVNPIACDGSGLCFELLPELISPDDWGFPMVAAAPIPEELRTEVRRAVSACPKLALLIERTHDR
jgi:ferredoxin